MFERTKLSAQPEAKMRQKAAAAAMPRAADRSIEFEARGRWQWAACADRMMTKSLTKAAGAADAREVHAVYKGAEGVWSTGLAATTRQGLTSGCCCREGGA
jgi:hypothetical protein